MSNNATHHNKNESGSSGWQVPRFDPAAEHSETRMPDQRHDMKKVSNMATTKRDVDRTYCRMVKAAREAGLDVEGWFYQSGSTTNGISWALGHSVGAGNDIVGLPSFGHIGKTAREAEHFLAGMVAAFESINYAKRRLS